SKSRKLKTCFKVISLPPAYSVPDLSYHTHDDQLQLFKKIVRRGSFSSPHQISTANLDLQLEMQGNSWC
ncbi:hypothetical protein MKW98_021408, partial [Papaver atlanticum]